MNIKELAEQAGAKFYANTILVNGKDADDFVKRFAELVRADEREEIARMFETQVELKGLETEPLVLQFALDMITSFAKFIRERK